MLNNSLNYNKQITNYPGLPRYIARAGKQYTIYNYQNPIFLNRFKLSGSYNLMFVYCIFEFVYCLPALACHIGRPGQFVYCTLFIIISILWYVR